MIRAKIIEDDRFYKIRRNMLVLIGLPGMPFAIFYDRLGISPWYAILIILAYLIFFLILIRYKKFMESSFGIRQIAFAEDHIQILDAKGKDIKEDYPVKEMRNLQISYSMPQESLKDIAKEWKNDYKQSYLSFNLDNKGYRFDFVVDSYYMMEELKKLTDTWCSNGVRIDSNLATSQ